MLYKRGTPPRVYPFLCLKKDKGGISMKVNGEIVTLTEPVSLKEFLEKSGYSTGRIAVERNGDIVPKQTYDAIMLTEADTLEIVHFVGGG